MWKVFYVIQRIFQHKSSMTVISYRINHTFLKRNNGSKKLFPFKNKLLMLLWISWWGGEYLEAKQTEPSLSTQNMTRFGTKTSSVGDQYSPKLSQSQFYNYYEMQIMLNTKIKHAPNRVIKIGWAKTNLPTYDYRAKPQFTKPFIVNVTVKIIPHLNTEFQYWNQIFIVEKIRWTLGGTFDQLTQVSRVNISNHLRLKSKDSKYRSGIHGLKPVGFVASSSVLILGPNQGREI